MCIQHVYTIQTRIYFIITAISLELQSASDKDNKSEADVKSNNYEYKWHQMVKMCCRQTMSQP